MAQAPTPKQLEDSVEEVAWSVVQLGTHLGTAAAANLNKKDRVAQGCFDGALLHLRAVLEFLGNGDLRATHYARTWNLQAEAAAIDFDADGLRVDLNIHAAHLSKGRSAVPAPPAWDILGQASSVLELFGRFLNELPDTLEAERRRRQQFFDALSEARVQLAMAQKAIQGPS